jgi:hypothetical protein
MKKPGAGKGSLYEFGYFESPEEAAYWLELFAHEKQPLILPDYRRLQEVTQRLSDSAEAGHLAVREILTAFQYLHESLGHANIFCGWKGNSGKRCGGTVYQEIAEGGGYYQCTLILNHRTPIESRVSGPRNMTAESFWEMLSL